MVVTLLNGPNTSLLTKMNCNQINFEKINNKTIILDDLAAFKNLKTMVEDLFRNGRHNNLQIIYLAHYVKDVLPIVRENINRLYITINNSDTFFQSIIDAYALPKLNLEKWFEYRNQFEFGITEINTITKNFKIYNSQYNLVYDSNEQIEFDPAILVKNESYFFTGEDYNTLKQFLEHHSGQEIEVSRQMLLFILLCIVYKIK